MTTELNNLRENTNYIEIKSLTNKVRDEYSELWKKGKDLDNICYKEVLGKDINWFAETYRSQLKKTQGLFL